MHLSTFVRRAARLNPYGMATCHGDRKRSWAECSDRISRLSGSYLGQGLTAGDRFAILAQNSDEYFYALYSVANMGGISVPLNTRLAFADLSFCVGHSEATVIFVDQENLEMGRRLCATVAGLETLILLDGNQGEWNLSLEGLASSGTPSEGDYSADATAGIFYTGGTTGTPKGVMLSHANLSNNALNLQPCFQLSEDTRCLHASPMFHIAESFSIFGVTMVAGQHFFLRKFSVPGFVSAIEQHRITFTGVVPTMLNRVVKWDELKNFDLSSLEIFFYGGSPISVSDLHAATNSFSHVRFYQGYGLTETSPTITLLEPADHTFDEANAGRNRSAGRQVYSVDVSIRDEDGKQLPPGRNGEIYVRGGTVMQGYWRNPSATDEAMADGWFRTGDVGNLDKHGYLYVTDRIKDMIISGGENVYSLEVENVLAAHPAVLECAVIGVPDADWGERVHAVIRLQDRCSPEELLEHCQSQLAPYKCPKTFDFIKHDFPLTPVGKIAKNRLKADHESRFREERNRVHEK